MLGVMLLENQNKPKLDNNQKLTLRRESNIYKTTKDLNKLENLMLVKFLEMVANNTHKRDNSSRETQIMMEETTAQERNSTDDLSTLYLMT